MAAEDPMAALEKSFVDKVATLDPAALFEAYARVVPVFTANIITTADIPSGTFLATLTFKQVALIEKTLEAPGLLDYVVETTKRLVSSIHGVKRGEPLTLTGGVRDDDLMLVPASGAPLAITAPSAAASAIETMRQKVELRRLELEMASLEAAAKEVELRSKVLEKGAAAFTAEADQKIRESTLIGQIFTPENASLGALSMMFSGAVTMMITSSLKIGGQIAVGTAGAVGGLVQTGAQEAVGAVADLAQNAKDAVGAAAQSVNPLNLVWGAQPTPTPMPTPTPAPKPAFLDRAGQNADDISGSLIKLALLPFRSVEDWDLNVLKFSVFAATSIATFAVSKTVWTGIKALEKRGMITDVMTLLGRNPNLAQQDQGQFLQNVPRGPAPALANAPAPVYAPPPAPAPALTNAPAPAPVLALTNAPAPARALSLVPGGGDRKRRTFRNNKRRATRQKKKAPKVLGTPVFIY